ncbi:uncharacterized protein LOC125828401 [Solanum verrucosum]|uniref:uncharacterized protein LOC125828401 n=1 Tax=Solanum verrucosum TaxID=315347 RepID=UPI0020D19B45|nr:uncharacterized protein LOC125828401 [Solanum verrucosum]
MGHLAHSTDICVSRVEAVVSGLIQREIVAALTPIRAKLREHRERIDAHGPALDALTVRVEACEQGQGASKDVMALKDDIVGLRREVDELKSTDLSKLFGTVILPEVPSSDFPASSEIPPATTTGDATRDEADDETEVETDEVELGVRDTTVYDDLEDLEGAMV